MLKNFIGETTNATTGDLVLSSVTGRNQFSRFPNGSKVIYTVKDGDNRETGIGTYLTSGNKITRDTVLETLESGTLDTSHVQAVLTLSGGVSDVIAALTAQSAVSGSSPYLGGANSNHRFLNWGSEFHGATIQSLDSNEVWYFPVLILHPGFYTGFRLDFATGAGNYHAAFYDTKNGIPGVRLAIKVASTALAIGINTILWDEGAIYLSAGWYYTAMAFDTDNLLIESCATDSASGSICGFTFTAGDLRGRGALQVDRTYGALPQLADVDGISSGGDHKNVDGFMVHE